MPSESWSELCSTGRPLTCFGDRYAPERGPRLSLGLELAEPRGRRGSANGRDYLAAFAAWAASFSSLLACSSSSLAFSAWPCMSHSFAF